MSLTPSADLSTWLQHLESLHPKGQAGIELGLDRIRRVKERLGQTPFCPLILVGGTNGKGSVCAYLEAMLDRAGYKVGCYTSPHLLRYTERVRIGGQEVAEDALCAAFARVEAARGEEHLTYFEFGTLAAWEVFAAAGVEALILEVGLGGRLDAVNVYEPDVSVVTGIALDHTDWLGPTREHIGREKAGIFRPGKPAVCGDPKPPQSLLDQAAALGTDLRLLGRDYGYEKSQEERLQWRYWCRFPARDGAGAELLRRTLAYPGLRGGIQLANASTALTALECLRERLPVTMGAIRQGLIETELTGRFQVLPGKPALVLDVAHNPQAAAVLADNLGSMGFSTTPGVWWACWRIRTFLPPWPASRARWIAGSWRTWRCPGGPRRKCWRRPWQGWGEAEKFPDPAAAYQEALKRAGENDRILVFGSFHTVAGVLPRLADRHARS